ncbi:MAG TPA: globin domain-containing protein [Gammaproteobacteria bacterium]
MNSQELLLIKESVDRLRPQSQQFSTLFYQSLFRRMPQLEALFRDDPAVRLAKFTSMLSTFANAKNFDKLIPAIRGLAKRHTGYGVRREHYQHSREAMLDALAAGLGAEFTSELRSAWEKVLDAMIDVMEEAAESQSSAPVAVDASGGPVLIDAGLLQAIGGREVIERVHRRFYTTIFEDEWLGRFFWGKSRESLVKKQTDFMTACFGGENHYEGETPAIAHMHMFITDEAADYREHLLRQAIIAEGISEAIADRWMAVESAFRKAVIKKDISECVVRCVGQRPVKAPKPEGFPWPPVEEEVV